VFDGLDGRQGMVGESALLLAVWSDRLSVCCRRLYVVGIEVNSKSANASGCSGYI
jgi:hypothetical protein